MSKYRHEYKIEVSYFEYLQMKSKLDVIMHPDEHCKNGMYSISSLYFDNVYDKALNEKVHGVDKREKFRFRYYDDDTSFIRLEKKQKINGLCLKTSCPISKAEVQRVLSGSYDCLKDSDKELLHELAFKMDTQGLRPKNIVKYDRRAYVYEPGNVRVTFDMNLTAGIEPADFLKTDNSLSIIDGTSNIIMEVKYDEFIPAIIAETIGNKQGRVQAFSKYAQCRKYV